MAKSFQTLRTKMTPARICLHILPLSLGAINEQTYTRVRQKDWHHQSFHSLYAYRLR